MRIIAGLGNPGKKYEKTRHNAGFMAVDFLASQANLNWQTKEKFQALFSEAQGDLLLKPLTFMNNSGLTIQKTLSYYKLLPKTLGIIKKNSDLSERLIIIHDDKDLPLGKYKVSINSGSAGHNGIKSIINHIKTKNFTRIRLGISSDYKISRTSSFVLQNFSSPELKIISETIKSALEKEIDL